MPRIFRKRNKKKEEALGTDLDRFLVRAQYWLDFLEKRIRVYQNKLRRLDSVIKRAARRGEKHIVIEGLKARRILRSNLERYLGMYRNIQVVMSKIEIAQIIKGSTQVLSEGKEIIEKMSEEMPPEKVISVMDELRDAISKIEESASVAAEPLTTISLEELDEEEIEAEAERIIAEQSLPSLSEKEEKEEVKKEDLEKELREIIESRETE